MKRIVALVFTAAAFVVPATAAVAAPPAEPAGFECNVVDQLGIDTPANEAVLRCGDNRNT